MKIILLIAGTLSLALGIVGILLPLIPTTPFLLLSSLCYLRSSDRLYNWLLNQKHLGGIIRDYLLCGAVRKGVKISAVIILWFSLGLSMYFIDIPSVRILLATVGLGVSIHLVKLKTK